MMQQQHGNPRLRILHASPDTPVVDVYVDGSPTYPFIAFGQVSDYAEVAAGNHTVQLFRAGTDGMGIPYVAMDVGLGAGHDSGCWLHNCLCAGAVVCRGSRVCAAGSRADRLPGDRVDAGVSHLRSAGGGGPGHAIPADSGLTGRR